MATAKEVITSIEFILSDIATANIPEIDPVKVKAITAATDHISFLRSLQNNDLPPEFSSQMSNTADSLQELVNIILETKNNNKFRIQKLQDQIAVLKKHEGIHDVFKTDESEKNRFKNLTNWLYAIPTVIAILLTIIVFNTRPNSYTNALTQERKVNDSLKTEIRFLKDSTKTRK
jgi:hypothetical protein